MSNAAKAFVANYVWLPYGGLHSYTGTTEVDLRFPGQLMQAESGLYYNWNRQYDATTGRYIQADPLGLVDGSSRYAYVGNDPLQRVDPTGRLAIAAPAVAGWVDGLLGGAVGAIIGHEVWPHVSPNDIASDSTPSGDVCEAVIDTSSPEDPCAAQYAQVNRLIDELKKRKLDLILDRNNLPASGKNSIAGHVQQFHDKQTQLRSILNGLNSQGCTKYNPEAWSWATMPSPR